MQADFQEKSNKEKGFDDKKEACVRVRLTEILLYF